jgi:hypothetical protein
MHPSLQEVRHGPEPAVDLTGGRGQPTIDPGWETI